MTIDEAIKHAEEIAEEQNNLYKLCLPEYNCNGLKDCSALENGKDIDCLKCASEHEQLAEWLKELKDTRQAIKNIKAEIGKLTIYHTTEKGSELISKKAVFRVFNFVLNGNRDKE